MGKSILGTMLLALSVGGNAFGAVNLIVNPDFEDDRIGGALNWEMKYAFEMSETANHLEFLKGKGPNGRTALGFVGFRRGICFQHRNLKLVPGEDYRFSVWMRTKGLPEKGMQFLLHNFSWSEPTYAIHAPPDTNGEWVRLETVCKKMPTSIHGEYIVNLYFAKAMPEGSQLEIAAPELEPLTKKAQAESAPAPLLEAKGAFRIIPISPRLADVDADTGDMEFYYPADVPGNFGDYALIASVDGVPRATVPFNPTRRVKVSLGALPSGRHLLHVRLADKKDLCGSSIAENLYEIRARKVVTIKTGRRLNNLVTELFSGDLENKAYTFVNPCEGFVFIGLSDCGTSARATLDDEKAAIILPRPGEPLQTMRYLMPGAHTVTVRGATGGRIDIRAVKLLRLSGLGLKRKSNLKAYRYGRDFLRRFCYPWFNWTNLPWYDLRNANNPSHADLFTEFADRGMRFDSDVSLEANDSRRGRLKTLGAYVTKTDAWRFGYSLATDENAVEAPRDWHDHWAEMTWRTMSPSRSISVCWMDGYERPFVDPRAQATEIAAIVNSGDGRGINMLEAYSAALADEQATYAQEDRYFNFGNSAVAMVPAAKNSVLYHFAPFIMPGGWTDWSSPEGDFRVMLDHLVHRIATDPAACETLCGIGTGSLMDQDEEMIRWQIALFRHYAIEGRTDRLSELCGYRYKPGYVANCDFERGADGWQVEPAAADSLQHLTLKDYGRRFLCRKKMPAGTGDNVMRFVRQAERPNRLSQKISGLKPGNYYSLIFDSADEDAYRNPSGKDNRKDVRFRVDIAGAERVEELCSDYPGPLWAISRPGAKFIYRHRVVFKATAPEIRLTFLDRSRGEGERVADAIGRTRLLNFIVLRDYFLADQGGDIGKILEFADTEGGTIR